MPGRRRKAPLQDAFDTIAGFRDLVDETFEKITGKSIAAWLREFQPSPEKLLGGKQAVSSEAPSMSLDDAYMVLGLPQTASLEEAKRNYKHLAAIFHPDKGGYKEAMVLLNNAYVRILREYKRK